MNRAQSVDQFINQSKQWGVELKMLRNVLQSTALQEGIKWGAPCYTYNDKNVVGIGSFKSYFGLWFYQGALLADDKNVLINAQEGKTKAMRQWRMASAKDVKPAIIKRYVKESMCHFDAGRAIKSDRSKPIDVPQELRNAMRRRKGATAAFAKLKPGAQREFSEYVAAAKREDTKKRRLDKILPMIQNGVGLNDKYRS